ncbi:MAG: hypothetical protein HY342_00455 [Candidatus Lambdaproteobacteria bacterium]|nr:hypothetical protein [Candidatus Lambdaproteobacteria bacterium]
MLLRAAGARRFAAPGLAPDVPGPAARRPGALPLLASVLAAGLMLAAAPPTVRAQSGPPERLGRAESPIYDDNLDVARARAVRAAQLDTIRGALAELVEREWLVLFDGEIRRTMLRDIDQYISAYRVRRLDTSLDRTRYFAEVAAQIDRPRLEQDLRELGLPLLGDPRQPMQVLYERGDPLLSLSAVRELVLGRLREQLLRLNFNVAGVTALRSDQAALFAGGATDQARRATVLSEGEGVAGLFMEFAVPPQVTAGGEAPQAEFHARVYQSDNGALLGSFAHQSRRALDVAPGGRFVVADLEGGLVVPLVNQLQPGALKPFSRDASDPDSLALRVLGFASFQEQEEFEVAFFTRNSNFQDFALARLDERSVTYRGRIRGSRRILADRLRGMQVGPFRVREVYWIDGVLELDIERTVEPARLELKPFPAEERLPLQRRVIDAYLTTLNTATPAAHALGDPLFTEQEDNGWFDKANPLEFNASVYGFVDSRGDMDFYTGEFLEEGETLEILLLRLDRTSLAPTVRIYDVQRQRKTTEHFGERAVIKYRLPKGETRFFMEVGDRFGVIDGDSGGYLSYHYLLTVRRSVAPEKLAGTPNTRR